MKKICYAIMPYGGNDKELVDRFNMVYQLYMCLPSMDLGFEIIREDIQAQPGSITANIVHHLAEADLVIADLSNRNWNVAYELGIRHTLVKGKTILLCDDKTELTFDIRGFNVIRYSADNPADKMFNIQDAVRKAIDARLKVPTKADNLVHETFPFAHENLIDYISSEGDDATSQLIQLKSENESLKADNDALRAQLQEAGKSPSNAATHDGIAQKIQDAVNAMEYSGDRIVLKLRQALAAENVNHNEVQRLLQQALTEGYLTEGNFRSLYHMFRTQGQQPFTNLILEVAEQRYPASLDFKSYLADAYSDNYITRDKAIQYADEVLMVTIIDGKRYTACKKIDGDQLGACMNAYIGVRRFDIMIELIPQLLKQIPNQREMLLRNLATAYREVGNSHDQLETLKTLLHEFPMNDINQYRVYGFLERTNQHEQALYHLELAAALDPDDADYLLILAGFIFDKRLCRAEGGGLKKLNKREDCAKAALPYLMQAIQTDPSGRCLQKCRDFILRNGITKYEKIFEDWVHSNMPDYGISGLDYYCVEYLAQLVDILDEDMCDQIRIRENDVNDAD